MNCEPKETHFPAEGHMGQMLLHLESAHKSHDVGENENKVFSYQFLLRRHSDLLHLRCKSIHHHCSLKLVNYTPRLRAAKDKKREKDDIQMVKVSPYHKWKRRQIKCLQGRQLRDFYGNNRLSQVSGMGSVSSILADGCRYIFIRKHDKKEFKGQMWRRKNEGLSRCLQGIQFLPNIRAACRGKQLV